MIKVFIAAFGASICFSPLMVSALELEQSFDLGLKTTAVSYVQSKKIPASLAGPEYQLLGELSGFYNLVAYPGDNSELNFRYGINAHSLLDDASSSAGNVAGGNYRADDINSTLDWQFGQNLDRLNLLWYSSFGDFIFGRQAIAFGQAKIYSPIDVVQPKSVSVAATNYRGGVDAIRATWLVGAVSEFDAGYVFGQDQLAFARLKAYALGSDWELVALSVNQEQQIISVGTNGGIGELGLWQETALLTSDTDNDAGNKDALRVTVGADTTFFDDLYTFVELHYNGIGETNNYAANANKDFYQLGMVTAQGQWYASVQTSYPLNIASQIKVGATANLTDGSALLNSTLAVNASDALSVNLNATLPVMTEVSAQDEFSLYPYSLNLSLDWVF